MKAISLRLEQSQYERLRWLSYVDNKPVSAIIREAIDAHLKQLLVKPGQEWFWTEEWQAAEREAEADLEAGRYEAFDTLEKFVASLA